jgi:thiol peroxidase
MRFPQTQLEDERMDSPRGVTVQGRPFTLEGPELKEGEKAPDFNMVDTALKPVTLSDTGNQVRLISVVPSLDTPICDAQTKRLNEEAVNLPGVAIIAVSMDLPFAQKRWCGAFAVDRVRMFSDHRDASFGAAWGTLIKELRIESRAVFVLDKDDVIRYVEYVPEVASHPNYKAALAAVRQAMAQGA